MTYDNLSRILLRTAVAILLIAAAIRICTYSCNRSQSDTSIEHKADTVRIRDTIHIPRPVYITSKIIDTMTVLVQATDTLWLHDTLYINLPREQRTFTDTTYTAWISGYRPQLDSIHIYQRTEYITKEIKTVTKPKRWGLGLQAGYGVSFSNKQIKATPYIGIGISYNILTW